MLGMHGTWEANHAMHDCDLMICLGARFDDRVTGRIDAFSPGSKKIHLDIDASQINKMVRVDLPIVADAAKALREMVRFWKAQKHKADMPSAEGMVGADRQLAGARNRWPIKQFRHASIKPQYAIDRLYELTRGRDVYITTEVGQHQMWAAQRFKFEEPNRWMTSRRAGHDGLWPAGGGGRADGASRTRW